MSRWDVFMFAFCLALLGVIWFVEWRQRRVMRLIHERWERDPEKFMREFPGPEL
jgi:hypothetical protein